MRTHALLLLTLSACIDQTEDIETSEPVARVVGWEPAHTIPVNSTYTETDPAISADGLELFFVSNRKDNVFYGRHFRMYRSVRLAREDIWTSPVEVELGSWPFEDDTAPTLSHDHLTIWFLRGQGSETPDLYVATRPHRSMEWSAPQLVTLDGLAVASPNVSPDGLALYFARNNDIYMSTRATTGSSWGAPIAITDLNSTLVEDGIAVARVEREAYFESNRGGAVRMYRSTRADKTAAWTTPDVVEDATISDGTRPDITADARDMVFVRNGDIYEASRP